MTEAPFDICGPLPSGVTVLEASAGTGKTYTLAALAARYVAQGTPLSRVLMITFTRMATGELRERVRERLAGVQRGLGLAHTGPRGAAQAASPQHEDPVVHALARADRDEIARRRDRLRHALANFDAATIATTHGFCHEVLCSLGIAGDVEPDTVLLDDEGDLLAEVLDDLYVRRFRNDDGRLREQLTRKQAGEIARAAVYNPLAPVLTADGEPAQTRGRLAEAVRTELQRRKRALGVMTYDDLLTRLHGALIGPGGAHVAARLRARWDVVLVDEFQDTDPLQWEIVRLAFASGTLVLIGDPKQAIYAFRGADVYAYLQAAATAGARATLDVNWRSDQGLIDACDALFGGAKLGHEGIVYRHVRATERHRTSGLQGATPLRVRVVRRDDPHVLTTPYGYARNASAREHIALDLAADVVRLLDADARLRDGSRVAPGHIAVLVPTNRNAALVREALAQAGVPAVINGAGSVFAAPPAREWLRLLAALERPSSPTRARAAALTCFLGWSAEDVAGADEQAWENVHRRLHEWARVLRLSGVAALAETITHQEDLPARILSLRGGERRLTDVRHVAQLLHGAASAEQLGTTALAAWLARRIAEAADDTGDEERSRRLESDAAAVQVLTIHRSKGLEFPIVYLPFLWEPGFVPRDPHPVVFHDAANGDRRTVDVALTGADYGRHRRHALAERRGEDLRLAYVALTRARNQVVLWWAGSSDSRDSPLGRLLFARDGDGNVAATGAGTPADDEAVARLHELAAAAPGCVSVEVARLQGPTHWSPAPAPPGELAVATLTRALDRSWRRTSYSDLTAAAHEEPLVASEPEEPLVLDEPEQPAAVAIAPAAGAGLDTPSLLGEMPMGVDVGTLVHRVLQDTDFAAGDLEAEIARNIAVAQAWRATDIGDPAQLTAGLAAMIRTPLGPLVADARLRDIARADRLDELRFELPLAGGDEPRGSFTISAIAQALRDHLAPEDPLAGYAQRLADPALRQAARGYLNGSLDLVMRLPGPRYAVVDYKTNRLGSLQAPLTAREHRPSALAAEMNQRHYGLQAILYTVALHRYLRWRVAGYDPDRDIAGVLYLFVRGMTGPDTPVVDAGRCGVFGWRPSGALTGRLSEILDASATS